MNSDEIRSKAASTQKRQGLVLALMLNAGTGLRPTDPIARLARTHIDATLGLVRDRGVTESTMNAYRSDLRRFGKWALSLRYVRSDPTVHLRDVKTTTPRAKRRPISRDQAKELVNVAEAAHPRDGMTALLLLCTGLRESEVAGLRIGDIDVENSTGLAYRPKQRDEHTLHFSRQATAALEKWFALYEERHGRLDSRWYLVPALAYRSDGSGLHRMNPLWPMEPSKPQQHIGYRVKDWLAAVGERDLRGRASHTLRRTAANLLLDATGDIRTVQTFLGHSSVAMTELYLDIDAAQVKLRQSLEGFEI